MDRAQFEKEINDRLEKVDCEHMVFTKSEVKRLMKTIIQQRAMALRYNESLESYRKTILGIDKMINYRV